MTEFLSFKIFVGACMSVIFLIIILGNFFVLYSIASYPVLKTPQNLYIVSLALSDLFIGLLAPFSLVEYLTGERVFGVELCIVQISLDNYFSTVSIWSIALIALDRYWSITKPVTYIRQRTWKRARNSIFIAWALSAMLSFPHLFLSVWFTDPIECGFPRRFWYIIFTCLFMFYIPACVVVGTYIKIHQVAQTHAKLAADKSAYGSPMAETKLNKNSNRGEVGHGKATGSIVEKQSPTVSNKDFLDSEQNNFSKPILNSETLDYSNHKNINDRKSVDLECISASKTGITFTKSITENLHMGEIIKSKQKGSAENEACSLRKKKSKREKTANKVVALLVGVFIFFWLPFFLTYTVSAFCPDCHEIHFSLSTLCILVYSNSAFNPLIYTVFNHRFREVFLKFFCIPRRNSSIIPS